MSHIRTSKRMDFKDRATYTYECKSETHVLIISVLEFGLQVESTEKNDVC